jgi:hypothetical protein
MTSKEQKMGNVFQKIKQVQDLVKKLYPKMTLQELTQEVQFLTNNWHGKKKKKKIKLTQQQLTLYELFMKNSLNPSTVYGWLLIATAPSDLKEKVRHNELSIRNALAERKKQRQLLSTTDREFIDAIIKCVENFVSEPNENYPGKIHG